MADSRSSLFFALGAGAKFNKKRFTDDVSMFEKSRPAEQNKENVSKGASALDFFGNGNSSGKSEAQETKSKKRRADESESEDDSEDGDYEDDGGEDDSDDDDDFNEEEEGDEEEDEEDDDGGEDFVEGKTRRGSDGDVKVFKKTKQDEDDSEDEEMAALNKEQETKKMETNILKKKQRIKTLGGDVPEPLKNFDDLLSNYKVPQFLMRNIAEEGYDEPTPIQTQAIPCLLKGRELLACAPTGSGKTAAFAIPILAGLKKPAKVGFRAVVIAPTRELAMQTYRVFRFLSKGKDFRLCVLTKASAANIRLSGQGSKRFDVLITTPLRLVHYIKQGDVDLSKVQYLVLDEADKLFELGFLDQVDEIIAACTNSDIKRALFSATMLPGVEDMARSFLRDPIRVTIGARNAAADTVNQKLMFVSEEGKLLAIRQIFAKGIRPPVMIFVQSKDRAKELFRELVYDGINVDVIHADRSKSQRDQIVTNFRKGRIWVLIATDVMARGVDFKGISMVINYDLPQSVTSYIHRIGRTGRAGRVGEAITFFTESDKEMLRSIAVVVKDSGGEVPDWMLSLKKPKRVKHSMIDRRPPERPKITTMSSYDDKKIKHKKDIIRNSKKKQKKE